MQTVGPYRLQQALGTCQVGDVWSATDALNNQVTVAVLNADAVRDPGWRSAFAAAANGLVQAGRLPIVAADYGVATPWIAVAAGDGSVVGQVFVTLGMSYQPVISEPGEPKVPDPAASDEPTQLADAVPPTPEADPLEPVSGAPALGMARVPSQPVSAAPTSEDDPPTGELALESVSGAPVSASAPAPSPSPPPVVPPPPPSPPPSPPVSAPPSSPPPIATVPPQPMPGMPSPTVPAASPYDPYAADLAYSGRSRRRTWLVVGLVLIGLIVLGGGGAGAVAFTLLPDDSKAEPPLSASPLAAVTATAPAAVAQPGVEPPLDGEWPADWPTFEEGEATPITNLAGVGFPFEVPEGWSCTPVATTDEVAHYTCGPGGRNDLLGGDLIVRACPDPCDAERRVEMRRAEEAWGLQWVRDSGYRSWAETDEIDDEPRYGLVLVGYWRTAPEGRIDRQVVFRMTASVEQADEIRMVGGSVRGAIHELTPG